MPNQSPLPTLTATSCSGRPTEQGAVNKSSWGLLRIPSNDASPHDDGSDLKTSLMFPNIQPNLAYQQPHLSSFSTAGVVTRSNEHAPSLYGPMSSYPNVASNHPSGQPSQEHTARDTGGGGRITETRRESILLEFVCPGEATLSPADHAFVQRQRGRQEQASSAQDQNISRKSPVNTGISCPSILQVTDSYLDQATLAAQLYQTACSQTEEDTNNLPQVLQPYVARLGNDQFQRWSRGGQGDPEKVWAETQAKCFDLVGIKTGGEVLNKWSLNQESSCYLVSRILSARIPLNVYTIEILVIPGLSKRRTQGGVKLCIDQKTISPSSSSRTVQLMQYDAEAHLYD